MRERIFLVPRMDLRVRDPITKECLPVEGMEVERSSFWIRRIKDGDVSVVAAVKSRNKFKKEG